MDCEELAKAFCEMCFLRSRKCAGSDKIISIAGEDGVLLCIRCAERKILVGEIASEMALTPSRVTNIIRTLEKKGYVSRENDEKDRRKVYISLTEDGDRHISAQYQNALRTYSLLFERLGEQDSREYFRILERIHEIMKNMTEEGIL